MLSGYTQSALGRRVAETLEALDDPEEIRRRCALIGECRQVLSHVSFGFGTLRDISATLAKLTIRQFALEPAELLAVLAHLELASALREGFYDIAAEERRQLREISKLIGRIADFQSLASQVKRTILPSGEIDDRASSELRKIRSEAASLRARVLAALERMLDASSASAAQDDIITIRNDRFVIPIRSEHRGKVPGVVHGISSSGHTVFIEPLSTIESNNELVKLHELEAREIERILMELTAAVAGRREEIAALEDVFAQLDFAFGMAKFAREYDCTAPSIEEGLPLDLSGVRHPLLDRKLRGKNTRAVPVSLTLEFRRCPVMIVSGPNAGGKTVALKTTGLAVWMAHAGLHVQASAARVPLLREMLADIGDHQSVEASLSTFTAHMMAIKEMLERADGRTLVLLDELGSGTDPDEGAALGEAIIDHFQDRGAMVIATTHAPALKMHALDREGILNASVEFDERTLSPTFRLVTGVAGTSKGIEIARRAGIPAEIVDRAQLRRTQSEVQTQQYLDELKRRVLQQRDLTAALEEERQAVAARYQELDRVYQRKEADLDHAMQKKLAEMMAKFQKRADEVIEELRAQVSAGAPSRMPVLQKSRDRKVAALAREFARELKPTAAMPAGLPETPPAAANFMPLASGEAPRPGDRVFVASVNREGIVQSVAEETAEVLVGAMRMRVALGDLSKIASGTNARPAPQLDYKLVEREEAPPELNLLGRKVEEAREMTDKYLDAAVLGHLSQVRIVHGYGTGALRGSVRELLKTHPHVERFAPAPPNEGGDGATVVELRK